MPILFHDRVDAGQQLLERLTRFSGQKDTVVLGLPRGGVPVAYVIAKALQLPLDVFLVRKLGVPGQEELAMGAIASGGIKVFNEAIIRDLGISGEAIEEVIDREQKVLEERNRLFRGDAKPLDLKDRCVILVDDGIATGSTICAAITAIRKAGCKQLVVAVPLAPSHTLARLSGEVDEIICLQTPEPFHAIGNWYEDFSQTSDREVQRLLER